jgi:hypothetical protein
MACCSTSCRTSPVRPCVTGCRGKRSCPWPRHCASPRKSQTRSRTRTGRASSIGTSSRLHVRHGVAGAVGDQCAASLCTCDGRDHDVRIGSALPHDLLWSQEPQSGLRHSNSRWLNQCAALTSGGPCPATAYAIRTPSGASVKRICWLMLPPSCKGGLLPASRRSARERRQPGPSFGNGTHESRHIRTLIHGVAAYRAVLLRSGLCLVLD